MRNRNGKDREEHTGGTVRPAAGRPAVSVVIPTRNRPRRRRRALHSVLNQTVRDIEVIVVMDDADSEPRSTPPVGADPRVRTVRPQRRLGSAGARNAGVAAARAPWIAFLDDDDEWLPPKLARQLDAVRDASLPLPIASCRLLARQRHATRIWPRRTPAPGEAVAEYLFCRRGLFWGDGLVQTSTILAPAALLRRMPFVRRPRTPHDDLEWVIRASRVAGAGIVFPADPAPLAIWNIAEDQGRQSARSDWRRSVSWIRRLRPLVGRRAYAGFLLTYVSGVVGHAGRYEAVPHLVREAYRNGSPRPIDWLILALNICVPRRWQQSLALRFEVRSPRRMAWTGQKRRRARGIEGR